MGSPKHTVSRLVSTNAQPVFTPGEKVLVRTDKLEPDQYRPGVVSTVMALWNESRPQAYLCYLVKVDGQCWDSFIAEDCLKPLDTCKASK